MTVPVTDFKKVYKDLYTAIATPVEVDVPLLKFLTIDGVGDPSGPGYREAVEALYGVSYAVRFELKKSEIVEYPVMPLQGLWWGSEHNLTTVDRDTWNWTMMIMQPPQTVAELVTHAIDMTARKKPSAALNRIRLTEFAEGQCAQILHTGPYGGELPTITRLLDFIRGQGMQVGGKHHEIYLSSPTRTAPEKLKTIIRYPVTAA